VTGYVYRRRRGRVRIRQELRAPGRAVPPRVHLSRRDERLALKCLMGMAAVFLLLCVVVYGFGI